LIANEDVSNQLATPPSGRYRMVQILDDGTTGRPTWIVEITAMEVIRETKDG
jgi:hypothetical protein